MCLITDGMVELKTIYNKGEFFSFNGTKRGRNGGTICTLQYQRFLGLCFSKIHKKRQENVTACFLKISLYFLK
jgi:hypothetical protein